MFRNSRFALLLACSVVLAAADAASSAATHAKPAAKSAAKGDQLIQFHPITRKQYDSILKLSGGQPVISEARLISSGLSFSSLRDISSAIESGVQYVLNVTGLTTVNEKQPPTKVEGYPLCVIKVSDLDTPHGSGQQTDTANVNHGGYYVGDGSQSADQAAVNCVVVVKRGDDPSETANVFGTSNDLSYASTYNPYSRYGYYPPPPPPYFYDYWYNQNNEQNQIQDSERSDRNRNTHTGQTKGKSTDISDDYYQQAMLPLNPYYLQQLQPSYRQIGFPPNYPNYQFAGGYDPYAQAFNPIAGPLFGQQPVYSTGRYAQPRYTRYRRPSKQRHHRHRESSEEEGDYSGENY